MVTKVFNSVQESLMDLAASAQLEFSSGMFSGSAAAKVGITKKDGFKTLVTSATLDVQLVQLSIAKYAASDINQDLVTDFNNLPTSWTVDPLAFQGFLARWGTHVLVRQCLAASPSCFLAILLWLPFTLSHSRAFRRVSCSLLLCLGLAERLQGWGFV